MSENYGIDAENAKPTLHERIDNFFYHYKWHAIVALFLVFTIVICSFQMCSKQSYDVYVMYAGGYSVKKTASEDDVSEYQKINSVLMQQIEDFDGDGGRNVNFLTLFIPSDEEIREIENSDSGQKVNYSVVLDNSEIFEQNMAFSEYAVCLLSEHLFLEWCDKDDMQFFAEISKYTDDKIDTYEYVNEYGIRLGSTPLYHTAGMKILPEDTVICIRVMNGLSSRFNEEENRENYRRSEIMLKEMLSK